MSVIKLIETEIDDPAFVALAGSFISHYAELYRFPFVRVIQIDNWFGERWLGFAGKFKGIAGIRNRSLHTRLPVPPFRPSRVIAAYDFNRRPSGSYSRAPERFPTHREKNGGLIYHLYRTGLHCWYSGSTASNNVASLMIYEVSPAGHNAWYVQFQKAEEWQFTKCRNVSPNECMRIVQQHRERLKAYQPEA